MSNCMRWIQALRWQISSQAYMTVLLEGPSDLLTSLVRHSNPDRRTSQNGSTTRAACPVAASRAGGQPSKQDSFVWRQQHSAATYWFDVPSDVVNTFCQYKKLLRTLLATNRANGRAKAKGGLHHRAALHTGLIHVATATFGCNPLTRQCNRSRQDNLPAQKLLRTLLALPRADSTAACAPAAEPSCTGVCPAIFLGERRHVERGKVQRQEVTGPLSMRREM